MGLRLATSQPENPFFSWIKNSDNDSIIALLNFCQLASKNNGKNFYMNVPIQFCQEEDCLGVKGGPALGSKWGAQPQGIVCITSGNSLSTAALLGLFITKYNDSKSD